MVSAQHPVIIYVLYVFSGRKAAAAVTFREQHI